MSVGEQIKETTSATVWSFIGIEGAVVLSGRARRAEDVGKASITAFIGILAIYVITAVLSLGVMPVSELARLENPQMAGILEYAVGPWGAAMVNIGVILSLAGALLGWTIIAADCPYSAAKPQWFAVLFPVFNQRNNSAFYHSSFFQRLHVSGVLHFEHRDDNDTLFFQRGILSQNFR